MNNIQLQTIHISVNKSKFEKVTCINILLFEYEKNTCINISLFEMKTITICDIVCASSGQTGNYEVQVFNDAERRYGHFMDAVHRRNDTFYLISFKNVRSISML